MKIPEHYAFREPHVIIAEHDMLKMAFKYVLDHNSANFAPYHNTWHMMCVLKYTDYLITEEEKIQEFDTDSNLHRTSMLIAALFHDMCHTKGEYDDSINILKAKTWFKGFIRGIQNDREMMNGFALVEPDLDYITEIVCDLLTATQFPYILKDEELSHSQKIIRDADLMQAYEPNMFHHLIMGLSKESGKSYLESLSGNIIFHMKYANFYTKSGIKFRDEFRPLLIQEFESYIQILS